MNATVNTPEQASKSVNPLTRYLATLTPEQRKALSAKAAAASAAKARERKAANEAGAKVRDATQRQTATVAARAPVEAPEVERTYFVALLTGEDTLTWHRVKAGGPKRACRLARKAHPDGRAVGVCEAVLKGFRVGGQE